MTPDLVEIMARAMCETECSRAACEQALSCQLSANRDGYKLPIRNLLRALSEAGYVITPKEPTEKMIEAATRAADIWLIDAKRAYSAMLSAFLAEQGGEK